MSRNKPSRQGGRRAPTPPPPPPIQATVVQAAQPTPPPPPPPPQQPANQNSLDVDDDANGAENPEFNDFKKMSDDEKADVLIDALKDKPPSFLPDNDMQRFVWHLGGDNHPTVVPDTQLDATRGIDIYRQVAGIHDPTFNNDLTSAQIANQLVNGDLTMYSSSGGSAFGRAIYFGASYSEIQNGYGTYNTNRVRGGGGDRTLLRAKIAPGARGTTYGQLQSGLRQEIASGSKLGRALSRVKDSYSRESIYAMCKGYDYAHDGMHDYHMIYNRGCLLVSDRTKHNANDRSW